MHTPGQDGGTWGGEALCLAGGKGNGRAANNMLRKLYTPHGAASKIGKQPQGTHWARRARQLEDLLGRPCNNQHSGGDVQRQLALKDLQPVTQTNTGKGTYSDRGEKNQVRGRAHRGGQTRNTHRQADKKHVVADALQCTTHKRSKELPGRTRAGGQSNARQYKQAALPLKLGPQ